MSNNCIFVDCVKLACYTENRKKDGEKMSKIVIALGGNALGKAPEEQ